MHICSGAFGVSADEFFTSSAVANGKNRRNKIQKIQHFQRVRLVLIEKVHAVSNFNYVCAVRVRIVLQDKLRDSMCGTIDAKEDKNGKIKTTEKPAQEERRSSCGQPLGALATAPSMFAPRRRVDSPRTAQALSGNQQRNSFVQLHSGTSPATFVN